MLNFKLNRKGFTLIEVIIVIAIMSIIATISIVSWRSFSDATALGDTAKMIETKIKLAKSYSLSATNDVNYGVHLESGSVTIFPADSAYVFGDPDNQVFALTDGVEIYDGAGIDIGVGDDIVFSRLTGTTANSGIIGIRVASNPSKIKTITINLQGQTGTDSFGASSVPPISNARHVHYALNWNIKNATALTLAWTDSLGNMLATNNVTPIASYFNATQSIFDWTDTTLVKLGVSQKIRIHSWVDGLDNTILCVMRDQTETDTLKISFDTTVIATYTNNSGTITVTPGLTVNSMDPQ